MDHHRSTGLDLVYSLLLAAMAAMAVIAMVSMLAAKPSPANLVPKQIVVNRRARSDEHMMNRHGTSALAALLAVRVCPSPFALYCHSNFFRQDSIAIGCQSEDGRCAFCIVGLDGILRTCYIRRNCDLPCDPIQMPRVEFPTVCPPDAPADASCVTEADADQFFQFLRTTQELPYVCTDSTP